MVAYYGFNPFDIFIRRRFQIAMFGLHMIIPSCCVVSWKNRLSFGADACWNFGGSSQATHLLSIFGEGQGCHTWVCGRSHRGFRVIKLQYMMICLIWHVMILCLNILYTDAMHDMVWFSVDCTRARLWPRVAGRWRDACMRRINV